MYFQHALTAPDMTSTAQGIYVWGVFAASFFMRPIGSWLFGRIADTRGRKQSMVISISLMAISSFLFALLPTYEQVGMAAPFYYYWFDCYKVYRLGASTELLQPI